jgi:hypothetical protein
MPTLFILYKRGMATITSDHDDGLLAEHVRNIDSPIAPVIKGCTFYDINF